MADCFEGVGDERTTIGRQEAGLREWTSEIGRIYTRAAMREQLARISKRSGSGLLTPGASPGGIHGKITGGVTTGATGEEGGRYA